MKRAIVTLVLCSATVGMVALDYHLLMVPIDTTPLSLASSAKDTANVSLVAGRPSLAGKAVGDLPQTVARPLFWRSRQPIAAPAAAADTAERGVAEENPAPGELRLAGILHIGATSRRALIVWPQQPAGRWLEEGAEIDGWQVVSINPSGVRILLGSKLKQLEMN